ncbi:MAG: hypothetical protein FD143_3379, partial [Ignavibacteria bacterium]
MSLTARQNQIREIADQTTGHRNTLEWKRQCYGKLSASKFGAALRLISVYDRERIQAVRESMYAPDDFHHLPSCRWHIDNEKAAIAEYSRRTRRVVKPTGIWLYQSDMMYATPNGLLYEHDTNHQRTGIIYVKCPYRMRDVHLQLAKDWHKYLDYLDEEDCLSHSSDEYHEIQGNMCATDSDWCDFVIWTPNETSIQRIPYDAEWGEHTLHILGNIVEDKLIRDEDADNTAMPMMYPSTDEKIHDLKHITHPRDSLEEQIRGF